MLDNCISLVYNTHTHNWETANLLYNVEYLGESYDWKIHAVERFSK